MSIRPLLAGLLCVLLFAGTGTSAGASPRLRVSLPESFPSTPAAGLLRLDDGAFAYVPESAGTAPAPLLVLLHGSGGRAEELVRAFREEAERRGIILLAPQSKGATWDQFGAASGPRGSGSRVQRRSLSPFSADPPRIGKALEQILSRAAVDRTRMALGGFSDGASYALTMGAANPGLFRTVLAFSPGTALLPRELDKQQRFFISHGIRDRVLRFDIARDGIAEGLRRRGQALRFVPFDGGHGIPPAVQAEGIDYFLTPPA